MSAPLVKNKRRQTSADVDIDDEEGKRNKRAKAATESWPIPTPSQKQAHHEYTKRPESSEEEPDAARDADEVNERVKRGREDRNGVRVKAVRMALEGEPKDWR